MTYFSGLLFTRLLLRIQFIPLSFIKPMQLNKAVLKETSEEQGLCIIIPTYNNSKTLKGVINDVLQYSENVIVVNDGSTDETSQILTQFNQIDIVSYGENIGKGYALRKGFEFAIAKGYKYAVTIDADGQHFADDIPLFIEKIKDHPKAVIIGARNMEKEGIPGKSSFGNKFSNFWFWFETGIKQPDTQSGFRLYPLECIKVKKWITKKFEFEIEVLVRLAWSNVEITHVPVKVYYAPKETRISHFRPFIDFTRISILNTVLVMIALLYIKPRDFTKAAFSKSIRQHFREQVSDPKFSNSNLALSVSLGIFMGIAPIWGYQMVAAAFFAYILKLNKVIALISSNISIPPMIPILLFFSVKTGELLTGIHTGLSFSSEITFYTIKSLVVVYLVGSIAFALMMAVLAGILAFIVLYYFRKTASRVD